MGTRKSNKMLVFTPNIFMASYHTCAMCYYTCTMCHMGHPPYLWNG